jgi:hypothetical protein
LAVRERRGGEGAGLVSFPGWLGRFGHRVRPSWAVPFFFFFFVLIPFSYFLISCFRFRNSYTSLIWIKPKLTTSKLLNIVVQAYKQSFSVILRKKKCKKLNIVFN